MSHKNELAIVTGIFPPDSGGPAKFAESFLAWGAYNSHFISVISLTNGHEVKKRAEDSYLHLVSRNQTFISRFTKSVLAISKFMRANIPVLSNGMFFEVLFASLVTRNRTYVCKVPGDIVWERARNSGRTSLNIDEFQDCNLSLWLRLLRYLFSWSLRRAECVIVPSTHLKSLVEKWGIPPQKISLIYNSVDLKKFAPQSEKKNYDVITVCRLVPWKGVDEVIRACAELSLSLAVVGEGPERTRLEELSVQLGAKTSFLGEVSQDRLPKILDQASCFVLNSNFEATSYALIEARSVGLFSIANANTGSEEVVLDHRDGILCRKGYRDLLNALKRFRDDKAFVKSAVKAAQSRTRELFDMEKNFQTIWDLVVG